MNMRSVLGFVFGMVCIGVVAYVLLDANRQDAGITVKERVAPPAAATDAPSKSGARPAPIARRPAPEAAVTSPANVPAASPTTLYLSRESSNERYSPGGELDVILTLSQDGAEPVRAMGIEEQLPAGWEFVGFTGDIKPDVHRFADGKLELAWFNIPQFPAKISYRVRVPQDATGPKDFHGEALYRTTGDELRTGDIVMPLEQGEPGAPAPATPATTPAAAPESPPAAPAPAVDGAVAPAPGAAAPSEASAATENAEPVAATPETPAEQAAESSAPASAGSGLALATTVSTPAFTPGDVVEVSVQMGYDGGEAVTAVGLQTIIPDGWKFDGLSGGATPTIAPDAGRTGVLEFAWIQPPPWPATFTYRLRVPETENAARELSTTAMYRTSGDQLTSNTASATLTPKAP